MVAATRFAVVGDTALDVTVAPARPLRPAGDVPAAIRLSAGGQGANVAVRLARRGADVVLVSGLADDVAGSLLRAALAGEGVRLVPLPVERSVTIVALLDAARERSMLSDRRSLPVGDALRAALAEGGWVHCSGYPLLDDESGDALGDCLGSRAKTTRLSVGGGSFPPEPGLLERLRARLTAARPDLLIAGRDEAASLLGRQAGELRAAAAGLLALAPVVVVTDGASGSAAAVAGGDVLMVPAPEVDGPVVDTTGSGDAYAAALIAELAAPAVAGWPPSVPQLQRAMEAASLAGARAARVIGAQGRVEDEA